MNPAMNSKEENLFDRVSPLQGKHIFTNSFGDGEIDSITRKNDLSGLWVYFDSNSDGTIKLDCEEFLNDIDEVCEITE